MTRREAWAFALGAVLLAALSIRSLWAVPYLPTNDGPEAVLAAHLENHFSDPGTLYGQAYRPALQYAQRGFTWIFAPLEDPLGWRRALQVSLSIVVLLSAIGFAALVLAVDPKSWPVAWLGFPLAFSWSLYMGFFAFVVGTALGMVVIALGIRWEAGALRRVLLAVLLLLVAICHVFTAALAGLILLAVRVARARRGDRWREAALTMIVGLPAAVVLVAALLGRRSLAEIAHSHDVLVLPFSVTLGAFPRLLAPGGALRAWIALGVVVGAALFGLARVRRSASVPALFAVTGPLLVALSLVLPIHIPGWQFFAPRFLPMGVALCLLSLGALPLPRALLATAAFACSALWLPGTEALHVRLLASVEDAYDGLAAPVKRENVWLPIDLAPQGGMPLDPSSSEVPFLMPERHMHALCAVALGGVAPFIFSANPATDTVVVRPEFHAPPIPPERLLGAVESDRFDADPRFRAETLGELATYGMFYEGILVLGAEPRDLALLGERGYVADWAKGNVFLGHFVPCTLEVDFAGSTAPVLDVGVGPRTVFEDEALPIEPGRREGSAVTLSRAPCGNVWVRPHWPGEAGACTNGDAGGVIHARVAGPVTRVSCERRSP